MKTLYNLTFLLMITITHQTFGQDNNLVKNQVIDSKILKEKRLVSILTPANYAYSSQKPAVLYVLDAEWIFKYAKGLVNFLSNDLGAMPPLIVVGIYNTDRYRDLNATYNKKDSYFKFAEFMEKELMPYINKNYRSNGFNLIYGWSSGSGMVSAMMNQKTELFDAYIEGGSGIGPKTKAYLEKNIPTLNLKQKHLYVSTEGIGPRKKGLYVYQQMMQKLNPKGLRWKMEVLKGHQHVSALAQGLHNGLRFVFQDFVVPEKVVLKGLDAIKAYYKDLNQKFSFQVKMPIGVINESAFIMYYNSKKLEEAVKILKYGMKLYPKSPTIAGVLAEIYAEDKKPTLAAQLYKQALEKATAQKRLGLMMKYQALYNQLTNK